MELIFLILFGILVFVILGIGGWILKIIGYVIEFLFDGCMNSIGCLVWVIVFIVIICSI